MKSLLSLLSFIAFIIIIYLLFFIISGDLEKRYKTAKKEYTDLVGEKVIVNKDTLLITDYSMIFNKFYLNNGSEISKEYAIKKVIKKK